MNLAGGITAPGPARENLLQGDPARQEFHSPRPGAEDWEARDAVVLGSGQPGWQTTKPQRPDNNP
ncbi:hypothetical protein JOF48_000229 [Arthrobacter stackebrandtii]|uniref:Uncharacterized protein n=1 Tax=Arthrobacter stackebrandtii TaxID=272161 RepID=A0ABS4YRM6_9MICC|nr:hypothetical protein [Arthrobacter stackebrandtii]MBP2411430.1 hypothetical protein [Arthrobacter stackebrandtii]PYH00285.1 hypothetical protein CVV67_11065 [Arthrobacter stackebrandtii]